MVLLQFGLRSALVLRKNNETDEEAISDNNENWQKIRVFIPKGTQIRVCCATTITFVRSPNVQIIQISK